VRFQIFDSEWTEFLGLTAMAATPELRAAQLLFDEHGQEGVAESF
jgi:hypothetical protein